MPFASLFAILLLQSATPPTPRWPAKGSPEQRALWERNESAGREGEQRILVRQGFEPLSTISAAGRSVRQMWYSGWFPGSQIGVQVERLKSGVVILGVDTGGNAQKVSLPRKAWDDLLTTERGMYDRAYVPWDVPSPGAPPPPPPICHPDTLIFGAADRTRWTSTWWDSCSGRAGPETAFATELARLAVGTRRGCAFDARQPIASLRTCFATSAAGS